MRPVEVLDCVRAGPGGVLCRALGTCDIDGNGITFNKPDGSSFECAGPFVLADVIGLESVDAFKMPFSAHPHSGAAVCSILMEGRGFRAWDNHRGEEDSPLLPGGLYMLNAGYGGVHDEKLASAVATTKAVFRDGDDSSAEGFSFCQLWFNPGGLDELAPLSSQMIHPDNIPIFTDGPLALRVLGGEYGGQTSPLVLPYPLVLLHGRLEAGKAAELAFPDEYEGFIVLVKDSGDASVGHNSLSVGQTGLVSGGGVLELRATDEQKPALFICGMGVPHTKPFAKLLGFGGALLEATPEAARAKMSAYAADPQNFGRSVARGELPDLSRDFLEYTMVEGYQNRDDGLMRGCKARWSSSTR